MMSNKPLTRNDFLGLQFPLKKSAALGASTCYWFPSSANDGAHGKTTAAADSAYAKTTSRGDWRKDSCLKKAVNRSTSTPSIFDVLSQ